MLCSSIKLTVGSFYSHSVVLLFCRALIHEVPKDLKPSQIKHFETNVGKSTCRPTEDFGNQHLPDPLWKYECN